MKKNKNNKLRMFLAGSFVAFSLLYSIPNFFEKSPAVGIISKNDTVNLDFVESQIVKNKDLLEYKDIIKTDDKISVVFPNISEQMVGYEKINNIINDDYYKNLNLISTHPAFFDSINASSANLGLDLRGGVHFLMEIDTKELIDNKLKAYSKNIKNNLNIKTKIDSNSIVLKNNPDTLEFINDNYFDTFNVKEYENDIYLSMKPLKRKDFIDSVVKQNIITLNNRVNEIGVAEPSIQRQGENRIIIQLPGIQDTEKAKDIVGATATLDFKVVNENAFMEDEDNVLISNMEETAQYYFKKDSIISGESIIDASSGFDPETSSSVVSVSLDNAAGNVMLDFTRENTGKLMGSILKTVQYETRKLPDGTTEKYKISKERAINVARINGVFSNRFQITGLDDKEEAHKLAILLRSGALAAPVEIVEERTIGPNMGADNIAKGKLSILIGFILVLILMAARYKTLGMIANFCVFINMFALLAILSVLGATLTLPGIAGIILTVGMAVDGNVVIFERIKEEYKKKGKVKKSIENGYNKALSSILDANITTFIAALVLFGLGSGAIKGFAITLLIGIITSLITSIYLSRIIVENVYKNKKEIKF